MFPCRKFAYSYFNISQHFPSLKTSLAWYLVGPGYRLLLSRSREKPELILHLCWMQNFKIPRKVIRFWATSRKSKFMSLYSLKHFHKSQPAPNASPDSSTNPVCKLCVIAIYSPRGAYLTLSSQTRYCSYSQTECMATTFLEIDLYNYKNYKDYSCP